MTTTLAAHFTDPHATRSGALPPDPSRRFVLPEDSFYLKNMAALWANHPLLAAAIEAAESTPSYRVEPSRSGPPTLSVPAADGTLLQFHSRYDPIQEARQCLAGLDLQRNVAFCIHGLGLGYALELLFEQTCDEARFFIFESDVILLRTTFETRDLSRQLASGRILFFWQLDKPDLIVRLTRYSALLSVGCAHVEHAASARLRSVFHSQMRAWLDEFADYTRTNLNTLVYNSRRTAENVTRNLGYYVSAPGIKPLENHYRSYPAVIVSAGPSLRKNKHLLRGLGDRAVLIAVQTTLQPLLDMGVEPQFVTSLDYHTICTRFFEKLPPTLATHLVAEPKAAGEVFKLYPGPLSLLGNEFADNMLHEMPSDKPRLLAGATVAHLAFYLAEYLGCDPIIFVGQDLGFSDGLCYMPGTSYEDVWRPELSRFCSVEMKQWEQIVRDRPILRKIPDQQGRPMYTEERHFAYLQQFERDFAHSRSRVVDATEGGALKRGSTIMPFSQAIAEFCLRPLPAPPAFSSFSRRACSPYSSASPQPPSNSTPIPDALACLRRRCDDAVQIARISRQTLLLLEEIRDHHTDQKRVNRAIARIDPLRKQINGLGRTYDLITQLTQWTELRRFEADRLIAASKIDGLDRQLRQILRDIDNVRAVIAAAAEFEQLVQRTILQLEQEFAAALPKQEAA